MKRKGISFNDQNNISKSEKKDVHFIAERTLNKLKSGSSVKDVIAEGLSFSHRSTGCYICTRKTQTAPCPHCSRFICKACFSDCEVCSETVCRFCSATNFSKKYERVLCLECNDLDRKIKIRELDSS